MVNYQLKILRDAKNAVRGIHQGISTDIEENRRQIEAIGEELSELESRRKFIAPVKDEAIEYRVQSLMTHRESLEKKVPYLMARERLELQPDGRLALAMRALQTAYENALKVIFNHLLDFVTGSIERAGAYTIAETFRLIEVAAQLATEARADFPAIQVPRFEALELGRLEEFRALAEKNAGCKLAAIPAEWRGRSAEKNEEKAA